MMKKTGRFKVIYLQIAGAIVSLLLGLANISKESVPLIKKIQENKIKNEQEQAKTKAFEISQMPIQWQYRGNDGTWRYYGDYSNRFWARVNIQGIYEYSENPQYQIASNNEIVR
jgi:hypothetical protein